MNDAPPNEALRELGRALDRLAEALARDAAADSLVLDATIQRFEFCVELIWKTLKKLLEAEGQTARTPRESLQQAYVAEWLDDEQLWLAMMKDRNLTSHTYREALAGEIYGRVHHYYPAMRALYDLLVARSGAERGRHAP